jgi:histidyl-tRNA synthetase
MMKGAQRGSDRACVGETSPGGRVASLRKTHGRKTYRAPRGVRDVLPEEIPAWEFLETTARELARLCGFREIRPALLEETELFTRSVGEVTDIVEKEMFTLERGDASLSLRPEATAGIVRAYLEAGYPATAPVQRLFHVGPMFRYERPQKGRERMFTQLDVEALGSADPRLDAELVSMAAAFFERVGLTGLEIRISSMGDGDDRERARAALRGFLAPTLAQRCELCRARFERSVLRALDCKNERCRELSRGAPRLVDFLSPDNRAHFEAVRTHLADLGRSAEVDPSIVRGFDYYTRTVFEVHAPALGARSALCGGGRYDHLMRDLGGPDLGAGGFAIGFTGTLLVMPQLGLERRADAHVACAYVVAAGAGLEREVLRLADELRRAGQSAVYDTEGRGVKAQMKSAAKGGHRVAVILGEDELARGTVQLKDLHCEEQREVRRGDLVGELQTVLDGPEPRR